MAPDVPENQYSAQMFMESRGERDFSWKFVVGKDLKAVAMVSVTLSMCNLYNYFIVPTTVYKSKPSKLARGESLQILFCQ